MFRIMVMLLPFKPELFPFLIPFFMEFMMRDGVKVLMFLFPMVH